MRWISGSLVAMAVLLGAQSAFAVSLDTRYRVLDAYGNKAPPAYFLRIDDLFPGTEHVTFGADDILLDVFVDGTARMFGTTSIVEVDGGPPGAFASTWDLDVRFTAATGSNPDFQYFHLDKYAVTRELQNQADANNFILLREYPTDGSKPFRIGIGAIPDHKCNGPGPCLSATGWLGWGHFNDGGVITQHEGDTADFLMELKPLENPVPEPSAAMLLGVGALVVGRSLRRQRLRG